MEQWLPIVLLIVTLILVAVVLYFQFRAQSKAPPAPDLTPIERRLEELERRLGERLDATRGELDSAIRKVGADQAATLAEQRELLGTRFGDLQLALVKNIAEQMEAGRSAQTKELQEGRRSQDERLDKVDASLKAFSDAHTRTSAEQQEKLLALRESIQKQNTESLKTLQELLGGQLRELREASTASLGTLTINMQKQLGTLQEGTAASLKEVREKVEAQLGEARRENEAKLEKIRETVEEKLQTTLEKRLGESFRTVSQQLESVQKGLGEMQVLASGVGDLKKVLSNVSTRGALGELQLARILEEMMHPSQYESNVVTVPGSNNRVEFAIKLPGRDDNDTTVYLPIDSKFPTEDYQRLLDAYEAGDGEEVKRQRKALTTRLMNEAQQIREKYVAPPHTTDFALLFLPVEGLYAEALRIPGLFEDLQHRFKITLAGPLTTTALLNSLQLGFRTLAIEKRSSEVWEVLTAVKTEFAKFGDSIHAVSKKLDEARRKIDDVGVRSRAMGRRLRTVDTMDEAEATRLLFGESNDELAEAEDEPNEN